ncbi:hypothetical protein C8R43DRAFT_881366 [Mycena crocata]|nr:hypothetical protein C8R43DRAFT_881366 [Mycena crocata]
MANEISPFNDLEYLIHHIFLPQKLPQKDDSSFEADRALCTRLIQAADSFRREILVSTAGQQKWAAVLKALNQLAGVQQSMDGLAELIRNLGVCGAYIDCKSFRPTDGNIDTIVIPIAAQNAAVILRKHQTHTVVECFEVDPPNSEIMATTGRLLCVYPHAAIGLPNNTFDPLFCQELASFLAQMAVDVLPDSEPFVKKAGTQVSEFRDSASGHYIVHLLPAILRGYAGAFAADVYRTQKRVRNEILWKDARAPWRRNPLWLVIRVAIQSTLRQDSGSTDTLYKSFMIYLMTRILRDATEQGLSSEVLFSMRAKIARRVTKLAPMISTQLNAYAIRSSAAATNLLEGRWKAIRDEQEKSSHWVPATLNLEQDTHLSLPNSKAYIQQCIAQSEVGSAAPHAPQPTEPPRICQTSEFRTLTSGTLQNAFSGRDLDVFLALADFEASVQNNIDTWVSGPRVESDCEVIATLIKDYDSASRVRYQGDPQSQSMRLLVIFDLWVALDRLTIICHPELQDYSPEVPLEIFEPLLVRKALPLERVIHLQRYLRGRHQRAIHGQTVFTDETGWTTFSARYFASSVALQRLHSTILNDAQNERNAKIAELNQAKEEYNNLLRQARARRCTYWIDHWGYEKHSGSCEKCHLETKAENMRITVHEWPLPASSDDAKSVVFELRLPLAFRVWRDITSLVLGDIFAVESCKTADVYTKLDRYSGLTTYVVSTNQARVTYASSTKPFIVSHYRDQDVASATIDSVCKPNGLRYRLYDVSRNCWAAASFPRCSLHDACTPTLPSSSAYFPSSQTVAYTTHTPNSVLASQDQAHASLNLHEHISFGGLRSGGRLQWLNIISELCQRVLSFNHPEVHVLLAQAASQIGPISPQDTAEWHIDLGEHAFGRVLLTQLETLLSDIRDNWSNAMSVQTIVFLLCRWLVSAHMHADLIRRGCRLLRAARQVAYEWMCTLVSRLQKLTDEKMVADFQSRICTIAAICKATYDVDEIHFHHVLSSNEDVSFLIECSIVIHDNSPPRDADLGPLRTLLLRDRRLSHSIEPFLKARIEQDPDGLDKAIQTEWPGYRPGGPWVFSARENQCWARTTTAIVAGADPQVVDINIRDGRFLVDGKPLGRLPHEIVLHETYVRLFGKKILDVIPSRLPGMDFATRQAIYGAQIHFHLTRAKELIVKAQRDSAVYELIPHRKFDADLPTFFIQHYTHWLLLGQATSSAIEFRPCETWWQTDTDNWWIECASWRMRRRRLCMMDIHSPTFTMCSARVAALEETNYLTITVEGGLSRTDLQVALPRYKLSFFVNTDDELQSVDLRSMVVDSNQSAGTLFGLSRQLVLRAKDPNVTQSNDPCRRIVIVPFGKLIPRISGHHVKVNVVPSGANIRYFKYEIHTDLGYLKSSTLTAGLFKTLLHACTSHPLVDPLTGRTGTEEALGELVWARSFSFTSLDSEDITLLKNISSLSPERYFYPKHLAVMETVTWGPLWPSAQHYAFHPLANSILRFAEKLLVFQPESSSGGPPRQSFALEERQEKLHTRSASELSKLCPVEFSHFTPPLEHNRQYYPPANITLRSGTVESRVAAASYAADTASLVQAWPSSLHTIPHLRQEVESWDGISGNANTALNLSYNRSFTESGFLAPIWCRLYTQCVKERSFIQSSKLTFTLATISYQLPEYRSILPTLLAFATVGSKFLHYPCPQHPDHIYDFEYGLEPLSKDLTSLVLNSAVDFDSSSFAHLPKHHNETAHGFYSRCAYLLTERDKQIARVVRQLMFQWPCEKPSIPVPGDLLRTDDFREQVLERFRHWFRNRDFHQHLGHVQTIVNQHRTLGSPSIGPYQLLSIPFPPRNAFQPPSLLQVIQRQKRFVQDSFSSPIPVLDLKSVDENSTLSTVGLEAVLRDLSENPRSSSNAQLRRRYIDGIERSRIKLDSQSNVRSFSHPTTQTLHKYHEECRNGVTDSLGSIHSALQPHASLLQEAGQAPRINIRALFTQLLSSSLLPPPWSEKLVVLAQSVIRLQRSQRLLRFSRMRKEGDLTRELANSTFEEEGAFRKPEWLLIQIDSNFIVRPIQNAVANEMMAPSSNENTISQLNMGEGKSFVIVPLIAALLADANTLARVVVLKSLAVQTVQTLRNTLSGLLNRRVFYFPFSRDVQVRQAAHAQEIQSLFELCMRERGVWIAQPEHILSFKLMGLDLMLDAVPGTVDSVSSVLLRSQRWLNHNVRDVLDESDEILNVGYQLVYTSGRQAPLEDHPDRWTTIQGILAHVQLFAEQVAERFPTGIELHCADTAAAFHSRIRILTDQAGDYLVQIIGEKMLESNDYRFLTPEVRQDLLHFITEAEPSISLSRLRDTCEHTAVWNGILLRRGILAGGILVFALQQKRWRVDYGLDLRRTMLAVPYKAKDVPSLRTDFGHPDVAITLTCLSYYYGGLTDQQFDLCLDLLLALDNPALEYESWVRNENRTPPSVREVIGINMGDMAQRRDVLTPLFRGNLAVVNFYLRQVVFPKEAKQFPHKLATSAWDLAERKNHFVTGFSGTNDGRDLLPTSIAQRDPLDQLSTTAKVLSYLLQPESDEYHCLNDCSTKDFLGKMLVTEEPEIRVLLDVGAQMLDMQNSELARYWLSIASDKIKAVVYFDHSDHLMVMARDDSSELLVSSIYADQLEDCAVYLDDVHTRGTDLKLPVKTRAAITLGPGVTKDRLVQGAMRLRQLGQGQSVMFFAPLEIDRNIRLHSNLPGNHRISSRNIIQWVALQTISSIERSVPHWVKQGVGYKKRHRAWSRYSEEDSPSSVEGLRSTWVERESRTLQEMYDFTPSSMRKHQVFDIPDMAERLNDLGFSHIVEATNDEEQEREVAHEVERERQVERPPPAIPATHNLSPDVVKLVNKGIFHRNSPAFVSPFSIFEALHKKGKWSSQLLATEDFATTIKASGHPKDYIRPVNWILSASHGGGHLIIISPWEANELLPFIRASPYVHLHQYAPRTMMNMPSFEDLRFYALPASRPVLPQRWTTNDISQLNLLAGQLYLKDFPEYKRICDMLGLYVDDQVSGDGAAVKYESDGFVKPEHRRAAMVEECLFMESPLSAIKDLVSWRRKGLNYRSTHMGKILHAGLVREADF